MAVVGAGAFGGWTAWFLQRAGARVTLVDAWGAGNARSSSGGESRVLRQYYGPERMFTDMAARARELWQEHEPIFGARLFQETSLLGLVCRDDDDRARAGLEVLAQAGATVERLATADIAARFPIVSTAGVRWGFLEQRAGVLSARRACAIVRQAFEAAGGTYVQARAQPPRDASDLAHGLLLEEGARLVADAYVVCAGPWLSAWCPDHLSLSVTRQEVFYFGTPAGDAAHAELPVWFEDGERFWYGIPETEGRGFKLADDTPGEAFEPESGERVASAEGIARAREHLALRFPQLARAPLLESRVCQYTSTIDARFVLDRHPEHGNLWLVGGGSGHGFKHGPAVGELVAGCVLGTRSADVRFHLERWRA